MRRFLKSSVSNICYGLGFFGRKRKGLVVLTYHRVNDYLEPNDLVVSTVRFDEHMRYLAGSCDVLGVEEFLTGKILSEHGRPKVVVTFDDGYADNYQNAFPILRKYRLPATIFLTTDYMGTDIKKERYRNTPWQRDYLNEQEIREMVQNRITFAPHTATHPHLPRLGEDGQREEIKKSLGKLKELFPDCSLCQKIFCYPYGEYNDLTLKILKEEGVQTAFTVRSGINDDRARPLELFRVGINGEDTVFDVKKKIAGAFDGIYRLIQKYKSAGRFS
jgi:peptidoglycan/xylan/chitin deacetylase (PgdA/CDA1 family)